MSLIDSSANISLNGLALFEIYDSSACVNASIPVAAVMAFGNLSVSAGSKITRSGKRYGLTMPIFNSFSGKVTIAFGVTSDPVPEVVGMRIVGTPLF